MHPYTLTDCLPKIPEKFLLSSEEIQLLDNLTPQLWDEGYGSFLASEELHSYLSNYFNKDIKVRYQLILSDRHYHTDICEQTHKYNYVYKSGGIVVNTVWCLPNNQVSVRCKEHVWYKLNVKIPHGVFGITSPRCSITIKEEIDK